MSEVLYFLFINANNLDNITSMQLNRRSGVPNFTLRVHADPPNITPHHSPVDLLKLTVKIDRLLFASL